ncbi:GTP cyclohydrolase II RibA [Azospirillum oleiclasticum]|uniref:GTP cyclohydrolase II RibA n=1 Tax=Azospirillum oleiclasticum TaxID=2735135 RepID=UPI001B3B80AF
MAELRAGRPVVIEGDTGATLVATIDTISPATFDAFATLAGGGAVLTLPEPRARVLGLPADGAVAVPLSGMGHDAACRLAGGIDAPGPAVWHPADRIAEAAIGLAKLALLLPAVLMVPAGLCGPVPAGVHRVPLAALTEGADGAPHPLQIVSRARVPLAESVETVFVVFRGGAGLRDQVAIIVGSPDPDRPVPVRLHSACLTGDLFASLRCDCGDQLRQAVARLADEGGGVLVYLDQEGRGTGIANKMRAYDLQDHGLDTIDADAVLGYGADERRYDLAATMLLRLGFGRVRLFTNNPDKIAALARAGIEVVGRSALIGLVTVENRRYLAAKATRAGHLLDGLGMDGTRAVKADG